MDNQKCWFLTVEPGSDFDKLFQEWLENFHYQKKSRIDKQIEKEEEAYNFLRGLASKQERQRSLENLQRVKDQHRDYVRQHGRTWLDHPHK